MGAPALEKEVVLHARVVEGNCDDLEVCTSIDLEQSLHKVLLRDDVEDFMDNLLPKLHFIVTFREPLAEKGQSDHPEELVANVKC